MRDLRYLTPTLCHFLGIQPPSLANGEPVREVAKKPIKRALIYCPDAFGVHALTKYPHLKERLERSSDTSIELSSMFPPKTPVCFASLFTGGSPEEHGIRRYEKPVLACETLFDALVRAGKRTAIVAVRDSSIDKIFRDREIDYVSPAYDPLVTAKTLDLLESGEHDVIIVYHQEYDDLLHATGPFSKLGERALENHVASWELLLDAVARKWKSDYLVAFTPDHGGHVVPETGRGDHGDDRADDMLVRHFFVSR